MALLTPAAAMAQGNPGPYGKLFGRAPASSAGQEHTTVAVRSSIGANFDDALLAPEGSPADTPTQRGVSGSGSAVLTVDHRSSMFAASLTGGATRGEYYLQPSSYGNTQYFARASVNADLTTRFNAGLTAGYTHSPFYEFFSDFGRGPVGPNSGPGNAVPPYSPYATQMLENDSLEATATLTTRLTKQSWIDLSAHQNHTRFAEQPDSDVTVNGFNAIWRWSLTRGLGVHAGYGQEHIDLLSPDRVDYDTALIDAGIDFSREFSVARRTTLQFNTSTSVVQYQGAKGEFRVNGGVSLSKFFRRTWQATAQASRSTQFVPGFTEPLYANTVSAYLSGMFSTRLEFVAGVSAARGESSFSNATDYATYSGVSQLTFALAKHVGAYASYTAYWYEVPANAFTVTVPGSLARRMVSVGLTFYLPVYEKVRQGQ